MVSPSTTIIRELIPQLAASVGQVRSVPGKGDAWVAHVIGALEREHDERYQRMRRRIGFAERLGEMAGLNAGEIAQTTLGLFFHELLPAKSNGSKAARPWREYFLRNEAWLEPALEICQAIQFEGWQDTENAAEIVAKVAAVYDAQTLDRHERTLQVVEAIVAAAEGRVAQRIVDLLWTEDGQELCDHHFRRHPRGYKLDPHEIQRCLAMLYRVTPRLTANVTVQSLRFSGSQRQEADQADLKEVEEAVVPAEQPSAAFDNFDKRREALRTRRNDNDPADIPDRYGERQPEPEDTVALADPEQPYADPPPRARQLTQEQEERVNQITSVAPRSNGRKDALQVKERLQELRLQLGQIQQIAAQAEQLLSGIAPQIDDFAARIADVESVMDRWSHGRSAAA
jgi:hypothetical protein